MLQGTAGDTTHGPHAERTKGTPARSMVASVDSRLKLRNRQMGLSEVGFAKVHAEIILNISGVYAHNLCAVL